MGWFSKRSIWVGGVFWNEEKREWIDDGRYDRETHKKKVT